MSGPFHIWVDTHGEVCLTSQALTKMASWLILMQLQDLDELKHHSYGFPRLTQWITSGYFALSRILQRLDQLIGRLA